MRKRRCGKLSPGYKNGDWINKHYCKEKECNNKICYNNFKYGNRRCKSCANKGNRNPLFRKIGQKNPNYKDGKWIKKYYCKDCGKEIHKLTALRGNGRCHSCAQYATAKQRMKTRRNYDGKNNPNYIDGKSNEPYPLEFNSELKLRIRQRDSYQCQLCNMIEEEHLSIFGTFLTIHHIDYNKQNCEEENLISLCFYCNSRANHNRNYWKEYFKEKVCA